MKQAIHDFEKAKELAWAKPSKAENIGWQDIKSNEISKILSKISYNP
ncbi:hypothetical protein [Paenibacillus shenyangensis]|nr:hypothetical protein [Paenibacillus sp. A9]